MKMYREEGNFSSKKTGIMALKITLNLLLMDPRAMDVSEPVP